MEEVNERPRDAADSSPESPALIIGMGASAGGFEAFEHFFRQMPADSGMAFVVVQHLAPDHESLMPELLARHTGMPVAQVADGTRAEPNQIYVIPPNMVLTIQGGVLHLAEPVSGANTRGAIDKFFTSLAEDQGDKAVCILLSGAGTDGTLGLRTIKEHGGMAMAQTTDSARHDSIPRSAIATGLVDHILPVGEMPEKLLAYLRHLQSLRDRTGLKPPVENRANHLARIHALLRRRTGHDFSQYKENTILRRIQRRMQVVEAESLEAYVNLLRDDEAETTRLFNDLLIGVTHFFRDAEAFETLADQVIPKLFAGKGAGDEVRVCIIGCSSGEEVYSVAILLCEFMSKLQTRPQVKLFGTDIDEASLEIARLARYPASIEEHVSPERLERFFIKDHDTYQVKREIREMCIFSVHSVLRDPPFSRLNLICCRNLLIYFASEFQKQLIPLFHYALAPGGYLFLGPSENISAHADLFKPVDKSQRIFQRRDTVARPPASFPLTPVAAGFRPKTLHRPHSGEERNLASVVEKNLLREYAPACVVITEQGEALYFSGRTGKYLEPAEGEPTLDLVRMAREGLRTSLRAAIHKAVKTKSESVEERVSVRMNGGYATIELAVRPLREYSEDAGLYLVTFQDQPDESSKDAPREPSRSPMEDAIAHLERELRSTRENLQTTIEELETSNEELKSANEELQSANEELQSAKEEYQSLNEELETVNGELRGKIEDLDRANSDLQNLFTSTQIASIFLDSELRIRTFTPATSRIYRLLHSDIGRPITDFGQRLSEGDLAEDSRRVLRSFTPVERVIRRADTSDWFKMRILPYRTMEGAVEGVVITFVDVTEEKRSEEALLHMNDDLKQFAYAASHDLQEPLRMVISYSQLLASEYREKLDDKAKQYIDYSVEGALRVERLLRAMRLYWQAVEDPQDAHPTNARDALEEALKNLQSMVQETGAEVAYQELPDVPCNRSWLMQVFQNLISNSIKYRGTARPRIQISCERVGHEWVFSVADNGIGIEPQHFSRIFGMFRRLHGHEYPGEGIGLALCSKIIERCGGRIWVESQPGEGSTFKFTLPVVRESAAGGGGTFNALNLLNPKNQG
jgi:two-component system CheB/CheR fusion protein